MIHIFIGTKAQFIKMAPIMQELDRRGIAYNFIDAGQHAGITGALLREFKVRNPDVRLRRKSSNINTISQALIWGFTSMVRLIFKRNYVWESVFRKEHGICLIHGDTLTTMLSLIYAKRYGIQVAHVEAGLRSYHLLNPFPEEIIRLITMRFSDVLFAPSPWAHENLRKMGYAYKTINGQGNTIIDTLRFARHELDGDIQPNGPYVVATIHRVETLYSRSRLSVVSELLRCIAKERKVLFVLHSPTRQQLEAYDLYTTLDEHPNIIMLPLQPYLTFIGLLAEADFVLTDGGSIQEECYFLDVPCLIMRSKTERQEGIGENAYLAGFDLQTIRRFLKRLSHYKRKQTVAELQPSRTIVDYVQQWA